MGALRTRIDQLQKNGEEFLLSISPTPLANEKGLVYSLGYGGTRYNSAKKQQRGD